MNEAQIREVVRSEVARLACKIDPRDKKGLWTFLNSSLGLWLLSSVFLSGLTFVYSAVSTAKRIESERIERLSRVDSELELRFQPIMVTIETFRVRRSQASSENKRKHSELQMLAKQAGGALTNLVTIESSRDRLTAEETRPLFFVPDKDEPYQIEFRNHTVSSLFAEGYQLSKERREKAAIRAALQCLQAARSYDRDGRMLASGQLPSKAYSTLTTDAGSSDEERKRFEAATLKTVTSIHATQYREFFEDQISKAWDYWRRRSEVKESELPSEQDPVNGRDARMHHDTASLSNRSSKPIQVDL